MALVTPGEFEYLKQHYGPTHDIYYSEVNENRFLHPATCAECREEARKTFLSGVVTLRGCCNLPGKRGKKIDVSCVVAGIGCSVTIGELKKKHLVPYFIENHSVMVDYSSMRLGPLDSEWGDDKTLFEVGVLEGATIAVTVVGDVTEVAQQPTAPTGPEQGFANSRLLEGSGVSPLPPSPQTMANAPFWACGSCTLDNPLSRKTCDCCGEARKK